MKSLVVIGGGAAGFFSAICCKNIHVTILEKTRQLLAKVRISGGGRCNVTHHCFDPVELTKNYPRGGKALRGPLSRFQPLDTIEWFACRNVPLKVEGDGRMFPTTDSSSTIINCFMEEAKKRSVEIYTKSSIESVSKVGEKFIIHLTDRSICCDAVLLATGSSRFGYDLAARFGHTIIAPVPSLFTFATPESPLLELAGISTDVEATIEEAGLRQKGPLLLTHWGLSGPAVLKLSAWGARFLHEKNYRATLAIRWLSASDEEIQRALSKNRGGNPFPSLPKKLWQKLIHTDRAWAHLRKADIALMVQKLTRDLYKIEGKATYKSEFVTCGGVALQEVNFTTMESKLCPGLYFAGEILDIDGVTGGFNFQSAWTTGYCAAKAISS